MRASSILSVLLAPMLASAMLAIRSLTYANGTLTIVEYAWPDAPAQFDIAVISGGQQQVVESGLTPANGTTTVQLPPTTPPGTYTIAFVGAGANSTTTYSTSEPFTVQASDFSGASAAPASTTYTESNGSVTVLAISTVTPSTVLTVTPSASVLTTQTVLTSGSLTSTILETTTVTPKPTATTSLGAATATVNTSTKKSGALGTVNRPATAVGAAVAGAVFVAAALVL